MKRTLTIAGAVALFTWTALGLLAWANVARHTADRPTEGETRTTDEHALLALADEVGALHQDVRALGKALGENFQALNEGLQASQDEHASALELRLNELRDEVGSQVSHTSPDELADLVRELTTLRDALPASGAAGSAAQLVPHSAEPAAARPSQLEHASDATALVAPARGPASARPRKSFLAFELPSDDFRFDERRTWAVLPALSRVGFDARTTLHDFTATTSAIEGELEADLAGPGDAPRALLRVQAARLASGSDERDEAMREHLAVAQHPTLTFELARFEPVEVDLVAMRATGLVRGRMSVRGVTQEVAMPVKLSVDDARRLCVEGEMALDLTRFGVPVPNKLGLITMEHEVVVWISLRLRATPRSEG